MEAGLTPDPERTQRTVNSKVEQMSFRQTLLKNIHNPSGETSISSTNQSQRASSTDKCPPNTPPKQKWAVNYSVKLLDVCFALTKGGSERQYLSALCGGSYYICSCG